ncbi:MAG: chromosome partitioning protein ParB, partial [Thermoleophilia bacterium]|nr:chromosome partitioning protein ParB [Thermoleophilia bacterium]
EALGYVYGGVLHDEEMARYRAQRDVWRERAEVAGQALAEASDPEAADAALVAMIRAKIEVDQIGSVGRVVTTMVMSPASPMGVEVRCYAPEEPEAEADDTVEGEAPTRPVAPPAYIPPEVEAPEPETDGVNHALHAVRTDVASRGLIRALADDPGAALVALIARLFTLLVLRVHVARSDSALAILATGFNPPGGRMIETLDGEVRQRLDQRRATWEASGETVIAWIHALPHGEKMALLAELTAISLDVREERTTLIRRRARAEAAELAALCGADITLHWTPDAPFLQSHSKPWLLAMLTDMGAEDLRATSLKKTELVDWVAEQAASRSWAPIGLSWAGSDDPEASDGEEEAEPVDELDDAPDDGAGAFAVTHAGEAALAPAAA